ncbi:LacI family DNA-binding transcriptional regulator [Mycetocola tolaasinivorans]|nr:LacI family DNA-binding transcriptional regulator [Mycetocola tolaasinivorans]
MSAEIRLQDVADAAGVSIATASRALAGKDRVSRKTQALVKRTAERLGYQVNAAARALREGSNRTIGMIIPVVGNPYYAQVVHAVEAELQEQDLELIIADSHGEIEREARRIDLLLGGRVEGLIVVPSDAQGSSEALAKAAARIPLVQLDRRVEGLATDFIGVDNDRGIDLVIAHLREQGARSIVYIGANDNTSVGRERRLAFARSAEGLEIHEPIFGNFSREYGLEAGAALVARGALPDAIVCGDDLIAVGVLGALRAAGKRVPRDTLLTGFDDTLLAEITDPPLTSVVQPIAALAREAIRALLMRTEDRHSPTVYSRIAPQLVVRESTQYTEPGL